MGSEGLYGRADLAGLNLAQYPAVLVELGNMNNGDDAALIESADGRAKYAAAVAQGIRGFSQRKSFSELVIAVNSVETGLTHGRQLARRQSWQVRRRVRAESDAAYRICGARWPRSSAPRSSPFEEDLRARLGERATPPVRPVGRLVPPCNRGGGGPSYDHPRMSGYGVVFLGRGR